MLLAWKSFSAVGVKSPCQESLRKEHVNQNFQNINSKLLSETLIFQVRNWAYHFGRSKSSASIVSKPLESLFDLFMIEKPVQEFSVVLQNPVQYCCQTSWRSLTYSWWICYPLFSSLFFTPFSKSLPQCFHRVPGKNSPIGLRHGLKGPSLLPLGCLEGPESDHSCWPWGIVQGRWYRENNGHLV